MLRAGARHSLFLQETARQRDMEERERRTQALVKAEIGTQRRASAATWGIARNKAAQDATAVRMAELTADFEAVQAATGLSLAAWRSKPACFAMRFASAVSSLIYITGACARGRQCISKGNAVCREVSWKILRQIFGVRHELISGMCECKKQCIQR